VVEISCLKRAIWSRQPLVDGGRGPTSSFSVHGSVATILSGFVGLGLARGASADLLMLRMRMTE
jgi:hypothetical protein